MSIVVPILNKEYKVVVCWGDLNQLRRVLLRYHYNPDHVTETFLKDQTDSRRGLTFNEYRCYPVIWVNYDIPSSEAIGTLAHEAVHAVEFIFQSLDENILHSEIFAHSVGAIVRETIKSMNLLNNK